MFGLNKILFGGKSVGPKLSDLFPVAIFWDVDANELSVEEDKDFIVPRVLSRHMNKVEYLENLELLYPKELIKYYALNSPDILGNENIDFVAKRYGLNPLQFKKYIPNLNQYA